MLTSLTLERFKNFKAATLPMGPLTVLVGTNAAGKSNVRDAFRFLHGIARGYTLAEIIGEKWGEGGVLQWKGIRGGTQEAAFAGDSSFALRVAFRNEKKTGSYRIQVETGQAGKAPRVLAEQLEVDQKVVFDSASCTPPASDPEHIALRMGHSPGARGLGPQLTCLSHRPVIGQLTDTAKKEVQVAHREAAHWVIRELASMRFLDLEPEALRRPSLPGQTVLGDRGENLSSVLQAICEKPDLKQALAHWVAELTPMDAADFDFPADQTGKILVSLIEKGGAKISAHSASDGTLRFLAMVAALLGKDSSRFYFFEELDNGIHPARLHLLLSLIERQTRQGHIQMVATTHSPDLLGQLTPESLKTTSLVYRLPERREGRIVPILKLPQMKDVLQQQSLTRLHATGWLEDAAFLSDDTAEVQP